MDTNKLAQLLFPDITQTCADMEERYPPRKLPPDAAVTRFAPSPTGYLHLGNLYGALADERLARQSGGVFYLRIEDTDAKREVEGGVAFITDALNAFGITFDEGALAHGERGAYGPYRQSERGMIYQTYAKQLVRDGLAYPCFCTEEELAQMRAEQEAEKADFGYWGKWAVWRDAPIERVEQKLAAGEKFVLRFRSDASTQNKIKFTDMIKGTLEVTENSIDHVILKSDGIPTYHFAHAVDDHLMRTTHVVRDESWLSTVPFHLQLFRALGFKVPKYCHTAQVMKAEGSGKRKLSKRKDPEAFVSYYLEQGYPPAAVIEYLTTLLNSNFEQWRMANPSAPIGDFRFSTKKMATSGCLFDFAKLNDISKSVISRMSADEVYDGACAWAREHDKDLYTVLTRDPAYARSIFAIGRGGAKTRKDFWLWAQVREYIGFFYDEYFHITDGMPEGFAAEDIKKALLLFSQTLDTSDDPSGWFEKVKNVAAQIGYAPEVKLYKSNPQAYPGHVGDVSAFIRIAVTGRANSPDLYEVIRILGADRTRQRIAQAAEAL